MSTPDKASQEPVSSSIVPDSGSIAGNRDLSLIDDVQFKSKQYPAVGCIGHLPARAETVDRFKATCAERGLTAVCLEGSECGSIEDLAAVIRESHLRGLFFLPNAPSWLLQPLENVRELQQIALVRGGVHHLNIRCDIIRLNAFRFMLEAISRIIAAGYRRISVICCKSNSEFDDLSRHGASLAMRERNSARGVSIAFRETASFSRANENPSPTDVEWIRASRPQVLLCFPMVWCTWIREGKIKLPAHTHYASLLLHERSGLIGAVAGCESGESEVGMRAARMLANSIKYGRTGFPENPLEEVIHPRWIEGRSLPPYTMATSA